MPHRRPGHPFVVRAEGYHVVVVGTRFGVAVNGDRRVDVDVDEGIVEVWNDDVRLARLEPGRALEQPPSPTRRRPPAPERRRRSSATRRHKSTEPFELPVVPPDKRAAVARAGDDAAAALGDTPSPSSAHGEQQVAMLDAPGAAPAAETPAAARAALAAGDAPRALQIYRALAQRTGPSAENAAYEIGQDPEREAGPAGQRRRRLAPLPVATTRTASCASRRTCRSSRRWRAPATPTRRCPRRPTSCAAGPTASGAPRSRGWPAICTAARGDCRHAVGAYQVALGASRPRDAVEAANFHRAACLVRLGDGGGADALRGYLRSFPDGRFKRQATELVEQTAAAKTTNH